MESTKTAKKQANWKKYEQAKRRLKAKNLSSSEYQKRLKQIINKMKI